MCCLTATVLGLSTTYWLTFSCRFLAGVFGANSTVTKGFLGEIFRDEAGRAWGYAMYGVVYGVSGILGPFLAGVLAEPSQKYLSLFAGVRFWEDRPYALPCFLGALLAVGAWISTAFLLEESRGGGGHENGLAYQAVGDGEIDEDEDCSTSLPMATMPKLTVTPTPSIQLQSSQQHTPVATLLTPRSLTPIILYCTIALVNIIYMTVLPLYLSSPIALGGLALTSTQTSTSVTLIAISKLTVQLLRPDAVLGYLGTTGTYRTGMAMMVPIHLLLPLVSRVSRSPVAMWASLGPLLVTLGAAETMTYLAVILLITQSVPPERMGVAHGFASTCAAAMRTIGPAFAGWAWESGVRIGAFWLVFGVNAMMCCAVVVGAGWWEGRGERGRGVAGRGADWGPIPARVVAGVERRSRSRSRSDDRWNET